MHKTLEPEKLKRLQNALLNNGDEERNWAILTNSDTSFAGCTYELPDDLVITAVRSVPTHY